MGPFLLCLKGVYDRIQTAINLSLLIPPLVAVQAVLGVGVQIPIEAAHGPMAVQSLRNFVTWDNGSPPISTLR